MFTFLIVRRTDVDSMETLWRVIIFMEIFG